MTGLVQHFMYVLNYFLGTFLKKCVGKDEGSACLEYDASVLSQFFGLRLGKEPLDKCTSKSACFFDCRAAG